MFAAPNPDDRLPDCGHPGATLRIDSYYEELYGGRMGDGRWAWVVWCNHCDDISYQDV